MTLGNHQETFLFDAAELIIWANEQGYRTRGGELLRTQEMADIYAERGTGIKHSLHLEKLAIDINLFKDGEYLQETKDHEPLGEHWEKMSRENRWGGRYGDGNHYERVPGHVNEYWKSK